MRCFSEEGETTSWSKVDCELVKTQILRLNFNAHKGELSQANKSLIIKKLLPVLSDKYVLQIESYFDSKLNDTINVNTSLDRGIQVGNFLVEQGANPKYFTTSGFGNIRPLKVCYETDKENCNPLVLSKNTRIEYRVINTIRPREGEWTYDPETGIYCLKKKDILSGK